LSRQPYRTSIISLLRTSINISRRNAAAGCIYNQRSRSRQGNKIWIVRRNTISTVGLRDFNIASSNITRRRHDLERGPKVITNTDTAVACDYRVVETDKVTKSA
jgi:hypothetical protein